ncbi:hypothetical protein L218DRAFT_960182, partial [Marasmius fiardii PR-910]
DFEFGLKESHLKEAIEAHATGKTPPGPQAPIASDIQVPATATIQLKAAAVNPEDHGWIPVNWKVGDAKWADADQATKDEGVSRYQLYYNGHPNVYDYTLEFTNTKGWSFHFLDDTKDCYSCDTALNRDHYIKYNSKEPTIKFVKEGAHDVLPGIGRYGR